VRGLILKINSFVWVPLIAGIKTPGDLAFHDGGVSQRHNFWFLPSSKKARYFGAGVRKSRINTAKTIYASNLNKP